MDHPRGRQTRATLIGVPVSTTRTITGAMVDVGAAWRVSAVRWNSAQGIVVAWAVMMPAAGLVAALLCAVSGPALP